MLAPLSWILIYSEEIFFSLYSLAIDVLTCNLDTKYPHLWGIVSTSQAELQSICQTILAVCFFVEFIKVAIEMEGLNVKLLVTILAKFALAYGAMTYMGAVMEAVYATSGEWIASVGANPASLRSFELPLRTQLVGTLNNAGFFEGLGVFVITLLVSLSFLAVGIGVFLMAIGRGIEVIFLTAISSVPICLILFDHGHITKQFMLHFASVCVQGLTLILAMAAMPTIFDDVVDFSGFASGFTTDALSNIDDAALAATKLILCCFVTLLLVRKSGQFAKAALGQG